jgi:hypothetical protein
MKNCPGSESSSGGSHESKKGALERKPARRGTLRYDSTSFRNKVCEQREENNI